MRARGDLVAAGAAAGLLALTSLAGALLWLAGRPVHATAAPFTAHWLPHAGPGTPAALALAALVVLYGRRIAETLPWRGLLAATYTASAAWILSLALVDGWRRGVAGRLTTRHEYLSEVAGVGGIGDLLRGFSARIVDGPADAWTTHVAGHPPGAFLVFVGLDRAGLGGGAWAALMCIAVAAGGAVAVAVTLRALGDEAAARAAVPFLVLFPGAVWLGVSADGLFTGVTASGLALLAVALTRRSLLAGLGAGLLLGYALYLSYGFTLLAFLAAAVVLLARRVRPWSWPVLLMTGAAAVLVVVAFTAAGFWWLDGLHLVTVRYYQGIASVRPYAYWVVADLAILAVSAGLFAGVTARRALAAARGDRGPAVWLPIAALVTVLAADLSGYSKAEVERIWQPFVLWLMAGAVLVPGPSRRAWLVVQAAIALLANHLLLTTW